MSTVGLEGWLRRSAQPLGDAVCRGHAQYPALLQALQKWQQGFFGHFCILWSLICHSCAYTQLFLVYYSFFAFCYLKRHSLRYKHCSTAAKGSQVPACLISRIYVEMFEAGSLGLCALFTQPLDALRQFP